MRIVKITNHSRPLAQALTANYCDSFLCHLRGLTFVKSLDPHQALLMVYPSNSRLDTAIHMLFMWIDLGVAWVNHAGCVVDVRLARRWRPWYIARQPASFVLEMHVSRLVDFQIGDKVTFETA
jgi:hypothetical protein